MSYLLIRVLFFIAALTDVLVALNMPENLQKISAAKENSGNEMLKMMQFVFPIVTQIQMEVLRKYGFAEGREGKLFFIKSEILLKNI